MKTHLATSLRARQKGFTLIELIVVLVILGILAAFAIPRFAGINADARVAAMQGLAGALRSSAALVHGLALARNVTNDTTGLIQLEGQNIDITSAYPAATATGIERTILNLEGYIVAHNAGVSTFRPTSLPAGPCLVTYTAASGAVNQNAVTVANCS